MKVPDILAIAKEPESGMLNLKRLIVDFYVIFIDKMSIIIRRWKLDRLFALVEMRFEVLSALSTTSLFEVRKVQVGMWKVNNICNNL